MVRRALTILELEIPGDVRYVSLVRKSVKFLAASMGFQGEDLDDIEIATAEAVTNAIIHGTPTGSEGRINIRCHDGHGRFVVEVEDCGNGCVTHQKESAIIEGEHGRGIFIIEALMDDARALTDAHGTTIKMTKRKELLRKSA